MAAHLFFLGLVFSVACNFYSGSRQDIKIYLKHPTTINAKEISFATSELENAAAAGWLNLNLTWEATAGQCLVQTGKTSPWVGPE